MVKFKEKKDKKTLEKGKFFAITVALVMVLSTVGFLINGPFNDNPDELAYKNYKFIRTNTGWQTQLKTGNAYFYSTPEQTSYYYISDEIMGKLKAAPYFYVTSDFNSSLSKEIAQSEYDISELSFNHKKVYVIPGFLDENPSGVPVITCTNATKYTPVLVFVKSETTKVTNVNNCIFLEASSGSEVFALRDRILYGMLGII